MKLLWLPLLCLPFLAASQNWLPVVPGETQHYRLEDSNHITHTLRIDSTAQSGGNTHFFLNRIFQWKEIDGTLVAMKDQGQFLGQSMVLTPEGKLEIHSESFFLDTLLILYPTANPGQSWLAIPESNTMAEVTALEETMVLGVPDSVKTITFDNGAVWKLSKQYGLIQAPDFLHQNATVTLSGLETAGLGDRLYQMSDMFDYQAGDIFEFFQNSIYETGETDLWYKVKILEKPVSSQDTLEYLAEISTKETVSGLFNHVKYYQDTISTQYLKKDWERISSYNHQVVPAFWDGLTYATLSEPGILIGNPNPVGLVPLDTCSVYRVPDDPNNWLYHIEGGIICNPGYHYYEVFRPGIGRTLYSYSLIDYFYTERMIGAVMQGDTVYGQISPDWVFTQTQVFSLRDVLRPTPNPTNNTTSLPLPEGWTDGELLVYHLSGSLKKRQKVERTDRIQLDLSDLPNGLYLIKYQSKRGILTGKVIKM